MESSSSITIPESRLAFLRRWFSLRSFPTFWYTPSECNEARETLTPDPKNGTLKDSGSDSSSSSSSESESREYAELPSSRTSKLFTSSASGCCIKVDLGDPIVVDAQSRYLC